MILERSGENLNVSKTNDEYVLEGIFAQFGVENNNHRIYEEKEYLPHLDYLKKKISENRLLGELDHPDKFDISLSKVSHLIEDVRYDAKKRQIIGKIRLLDTPSGQIAKNLVDTGVPISISSRAAGVVGENKKVSIKRIFTYDLVADPGFENAVMSKVNESFGFDSHDESIAIYDVTTTFPAFLESVDSEEIYTETPEKIEKTMENNQSYVSLDEMNKYSLVIKNEIEKINDRLSKISESSDKNERIAKLEEELESIKSYASYLAETQNQAIQYANYLAEMNGKTIAYAQHIAEKADNGIQYAESLAEQHNLRSEYMDTLAEKLDQSIQYGEYKAGKINEAIKFGNYLAERMNETIGYAEHVAEHADNAIRYGEYLSENSTSKEEFKNIVEYAEYMFESMGVGSNEGKSNISEDNDNTNTPDRGVITNAIKESNNNDGSPIGRYASLDNKIQAVLESVQKQKAELNNQDSRYPFIQFLGENKKAEFLALNETEKKRVANALNSNPSFDEERIVTVWESALASVEVNEKWLTEMPTEYLGLWESASSDMKDRITRQAKMFRLETSYQIKNFWQTRGLGKVSESLSDNVITESKKAELLKESNSLGYSTEYLQNISESLGKRFK